jgi:hypothetical protein
MQRTVLIALTLANCALAHGKHPKARLSADGALIDRNGWRFHNGQ